MRTLAIPRSPLRARTSAVLGVRLALGGEIKFNPSDLFEHKDWIFIDPFD